jgi:molybdopterin/thiamine biosynthesis adenylyltransferase
MNFARQSGFVNPRKLASLSATIIGAGAVGSFTSLALAKMGVGKLKVYDDDGVTDHNLPNQFYRVADAEQSKYKVEALQEIIRDFSGTEIEIKRQMFDDEHDHTLNTNLVIAATDSITSRRYVWERYLRSRTCVGFLDARMGGEYGVVYAVFNKAALREKYTATLFPPEQAVELPCTERSIIYNVLPLAGFLCRGVKAYVNKEPFPFENILNLRDMEFSHSGTMADPKGKGKRR